MGDKKAFVFDTNFIMQNKDMEKVVSNLRDSFTVYVTQVSVEERIAQQCRKLKDKYGRLSALTKEYNKIAKIDILEDYEKRAEKYRSAIQSNYDKLFDDYVIPFLKTSKLFSEVLDRAFKKLPPFSSVDNASDKGFKDSLIWLSILDYFKENGESEVIFVSNDNGFKDNADMLCEEFEATTGKKIEIKDNSYYKSIIEDFHIEKEQVKQERLPDFERLREEIRNTIEALCGTETVDIWDNPSWERTFVIRKEVDADYMQVIFNNLRNNITNHIFDETVPASDILALDDRIANGSVGIPIVALENAMYLHDEIREKYPDYIDQFYTTSANIINRYHIAQSADIEDEMPF